jgi:hypothetical protein
MGDLISRWYWITTPSFCRIIKTSKMASFSAIIKKEANKQERVRRTPPSLKTLMKYQALLLLRLQILDSPTSSQPHKLKFLLRLSIAIRNKYRDN